ncbi:MAG: ABC transporter substrate-binding protein [Roseibium sp.]|uniref:ABC transporter substrate-binding protein n=1 Tax=Roseibium sp. TaxID=1936156 RepID=UPI002615A4AF|nr:ABC transporter substrate-binding protein [Roseibium sp.]MCV0425894.1 ABC transporter substrate-binding protein [Roseibium sp.]
MMNAYLKRVLAAGVVLGALGGAPALAKDLVMGRSTPQTVLDPHFTVQPTGNAMATDLYDGLVFFGEDLQLYPALATSWEPIDELTWEIKLRPNVRFHNGAKFTAKDIEYSLKRAGSMPNSPSPVTPQVAAVDEVEVVDDLTVRIKTKVPTPLLMNQIGEVFITSSEFGDVDTADFNSGKAAVGTGPYRLVSWIPGEAAELEANPEWWGGQPEFENVTVKFIADSSARVAALLSKQVDVIDAVPSEDVDFLRGQSGVEIHSSPSVRLLFLYLDLVNDNSPFVTDHEGRPLDINPLKDVRVRKALSKLIDREAITDHVFARLATPAGQVAVEGQGGYSKSLVPDQYDPDAAKVLLAEAGYPDGFGLTLHCATDRDVNTADAIQAMAQMIARGGIRINAVDCRPYSVYSAEATKGEYSAFMWGRSDKRPDTSLNLRNGYMTYDIDAGVGAWNRGRYSNREFDNLVQLALQEFDTEKRYDLLRQATEILIGEDMAILPVYFLNATWATRDGFTFDANKKVETSAQHVHAK